MDVRVEILGQARRGAVRHGKARLDALRGGIPAEVGQCAPRCGEAGQGEAWQGLANTRHLTGCRSLRHGLARPGKPRRGGARLDTLRSYGSAEVGRVVPRRGGACRCEARLGKHTVSQAGTEVCGAARRGLVRPGMARQTHSIPHGLLKFADNINNERKNQWKT
jgi:hypothetical protein